MFRAHVLKILSLAATAVVAVGCETSDDDKLGAAQACLDKAAQATVGDCLVGIESIPDTNESAARIRCGGYFIQGGLDSTKFKSAFTELKKDQGGSGTGTSAMMSFLVLKDVNGTVDTGVATRVKDSCTASGLSGMKTFGSFAYLATKMGSIAVGTNPDQIANALKDLTNSNVSNSDVGQTIKVIQSSNCSSSSPPDYCAQVNQAAAKCTTEEDLGACARALMAKATIPGPGIPACCTP